MQQRARGFTLIELLFLIAIIGAIAAMVLNSYQQRSNNLKTEKTALQMQQILQAGLNYFGDNRCWPNGNNCPNNPPAFSIYLPSGIVNNPWGNAYSYSEDPKNPTNFQVFSGKIPTTNLLGQVTAQLPNAAISLQDSAQVMTQSQATFTSKYVLESISTTQNYGNNNIASFSFTCPKGWVPGAIALPQFINTYNQMYNYLQICYGYGIGSQAISSYDTVKMACQVPPDSTTAVCSYQVVFSSYALKWYAFPSCNWYLSDGGITRFNQIGYCVNPNG